LNNFFTIKEILARFDPEVVRMFLLSKHYRSPIDFSDDGLAEVGRSLDRAYRSLQAAMDLAPGAENGQPGPENEEIKTRFQEAMNDDLNTAKALGHIFEAIKELNRLLDEARAGKDNQARINSWVVAIKDMGGVLGILNRDPLTWNGPVNLAGDAREDEFQNKIGLTRDEIEEMITKRQEARTKKDWAEADRIRDELKAHGILLEDAGGQTKWRIEV
jgi:cysteinyl-tRNA synthetase